MYALVTGADRGLGLAMTGMLLEHGWTVFAGRYLSRWDNLDKLHEQYPDRLFIVDMDVSSVSSVQAAGDAVREISDRLDLIVNNAGIVGKSTALTIGDPISEEDFSDMLNVYNVNALGQLRVINVFLPLLLQSRQRLIINIGSEAGSIDANWRDSMYGYCMSKAAVNMASSITHNHLFKTYGIKTLIIHPGGMATNMQVMDGRDTPQEDLSVRDVYLKPELVADRIYDFICDPERFIGNHPSYITYRGDPLKW